MLPPACRSKLENIFLALVIDADDRKSDGEETGRTSYNKEVFAPLIKELNYLENKGVLCHTELGEKVIYFVLTLVLGDNLGVHGILGFVEGFSANYPCSICRASKEQTAIMTREDVTLLRNCENFAADVHTNDCKRTGIKEECCFHVVDSYHVTENRNKDEMHDLSEGLSHYLTIPVLKHCIDSGYFSLDHLNTRLALFDYGPKDSSNIPPCIREGFHTKSKLKMTAAEIRSFVRLLGVIVGDLVPEVDKFGTCINSTGKLWKFYSPKTCRVIFQSIFQNLCMSITLSI